MRRVRRRRRSFQTSPLRDSATFCEGCSHIAAFFTRILLHAKCARLEVLRSSTHAKETTGCGSLGGAHFGTYGLFEIHTHAFWRIVLMTYDKHNLVGHAGVRGTLWGMSSAQGQNRNPAFSI